MSLEFKESDHTYWMEGKEVPGVSHILKTVGVSKDYSGIDPFYRDRGIAVHMAINLHLKGTLDEASLDPLIVPFFEGFKAYWAKHGRRIVAMEEMRYSEEYNYAGTLDLETELDIIDWKCSKSHDRVAELQGEGYKTLAGPPFKNFRVVQFPGDGTYKIFDYGTKVDIWPALIRVFNWKEKRK